MASLANRMVRAATLDRTLYEEVEADPRALNQAIIIVALGAVAAGIGDIFQGGMTRIIGSVVTALIAWLVWAGLTYFIGTKIMPEPQTKADFGQLVRTIGFASAPGVLRVFGVIPIFGRLAILAIAVWMFAASVVAVRQALDYQSTMRAVGVCVVGWIAMVLIMIMAGSLFY